MNKSVVAGVLIVVGLLGVGGGLAYWKHGSMKSQGGGGGYGEPAEAVEIVAARTARWRPTAQLSGTVIALQSITLACEVAGTVKEVSFESGDIVEAGQVLVRLDTSTEEADLRASQANVLVMDAGVKVAQADKSLAESNLHRLQQAVTARAASESELDTAEAAFAAATARAQRSAAEHEQAMARVEQMQATINKKTLRAPFRAVAGLRNIHPGQYLAEGATVVGLQSVSDKIYLDFALPQEHATRVKKGDVVMARAPMLGDKPIRIEVVALDAVASPTTRNVRLRAIVPNPGQILRPGMFVDVDAPSGEEREAVVVPQTAVRRSSFGDHVFVVTPEPADPAAPDAPRKLRAHQRFIKLGPSLGNDMIVLDKLAAGEEVAAAGAFKLRENALVSRGAGAELGTGAAAAQAEPSTTENAGK